MLDCRHAPHLEAPEETLAAAAEFSAAEPGGALRRPVRAQLRRAYGLEYLQADARARDGADRRCSAPTAPSRAASTRRSRSRWPRPGPPSRSCLPAGLIPSGLSNSTHVVADARDGVLEATARCRARGELEWLWDVEIGPPDGARAALATVAIAVRPRKM